MGPLDAVALSPTSTVESRSAQSNPLAAGAATKASHVNPDLQDLVEIANVPSLVQIAPLQTSSPTELQSVLSDAIRQLKAAEAQTTDPATLAFLTGLADSFQQLQEFGPPALSVAATTT